MLRSQMRPAAILVSVALLAVAIGGLTTAVQAHYSGARFHLHEVALPIVLL
jgi:hypothetical protein